MPFVVSVPVLSKHIIETLPATIVLSESTPKIPFYNLILFFHFY